MSGFFNRIVNTIPAPKTTLSSGGSQIATPTAQPASQVAPQPYAQQPQQQAPQPAQAPQPQQQVVQPAQAGQSQPQAPAKPFSDAFNQPTDVVKEPVHAPVAPDQQQIAQNRSEYDPNKADIARGLATIATPIQYSNKDMALKAFNDYQNAYNNAVNENGGRADEYILNQVNAKGNAAEAWRQYQKFLQDEVKAPPVVGTPPPTNSRPKNPAEVGPIGHPNPEPTPPPTAPTPTPGPIKKPGNPRG